MVNKQKKEKVFVGMSGGVDSSVSAALLLDQGYDVTGVFIKVWQPDWITCTWKEDRLDAMRVAAKLGIPFITLDLEKEYKKEVVDYMVSEYKKGRTPNPDVMCNRHVKFGGFYKWAMKQGADYVATGHYAQVAKRVTRNEKRMKGNQDTSFSDVTSYKLQVSSDPDKDQSYFLWTLTQDQLGHTLFPIGGFVKSEVRDLARKFGLPNAEKKDSQGLCFIGKIDVKEFLSHYIPVKKGKVLNESGEVIGEHEGAFFYTEGQRHGFTIVKKTPTEEPLYVISKDIKKNTLSVGTQKKEKEISPEELVLENVSWTSGEPILGHKYQARIRYRQPLRECTLEKRKGLFHVIFKEKQKAVSGGQSLVLYEGSVCLGGGIIRGFAEDK